MRIYLPPILNKLFSTAVLLLSVSLVAFLAAKAVETWSSDPALNKIPALMQKAK
ncbi:MAG: hypothetical protein ICV62_15515 [Cyanobacteria bacterium Co-bin13]|nr:hypothetical protein [Cyanobacteria bacterium Co-bin13]